VPKPVTTAYVGLYKSEVHIQLAVSEAILGRGRIDSLFSIPLTP